MFKFRRNALHATPELVGRICLVVKTTVLVYLCATYLSSVGLLAFLVYDNIETLVYLFVSGMTKTISPFITLFYNEHDYPSVEFLTKLSVKQILSFIVTISVVFMIFPQILLFLFNITVPAQQTVIALSIRITCLSLIGRCLSMIMADYAQAISSSKITALINFLREGLLPFALIIILIPLMGEVGIWVTLCLSDIIPVFVYLAITLYNRKQYSSFKNSALMISPYVSYHWTSIRGNFEEMNNNMQESNKQIIQNIKKVFDEDYLIITGALEDIAKNIFVVETTLSKIDISIIIYDNYTVLRFIYDGKTIYSL